MRCSNVEETGRFFSVYGKRRFKCLHLVRQVELPPAEKLTNVMQCFNYKKHSSPPASSEELIAEFKQNVGWSRLSPYEQSKIKAEVVRQVTIEIHRRVKELREYVRQRIQESGLDEKSELARVMAFIREIDLLIQGGHQS